MPQQSPLFEIRQYLIGPAQSLFVCSVRLAVRQIVFDLRVDSGAAGREDAERVDVILCRQADLPQVVLALRLRRAASRAA